MNIITTIIYAVIGITSFVSISSFINFIFSREKEDLLFALTSLFITIYNFLCIQLYNSHSIKEGYYWQSLQFVILPIISIFYLWFIIIYTKSMFRVMPIILTVIFAGYALIVLILRNNLNIKPMIREFILFTSFKITYYESKNLLFDFQFISGFIGQIFNLFLLYIYFIKGHKKDSIYIFVGFLITFISVLNDTFIGFGLYKFIYTMEYGFLALIISLVISLFLKQIDIKNKLFKSKAQLHEIAANIPGIVFQCISKPDRSIQINYISKRIDELFDININKPDYNKLKILVKNEDVEKIIRSSISFEDNKNIFINEFTISNKEIKTKWIRSYSNPRKVSDGEIIWNGVLIDISEKKAIEEEKENLIEQLNKKTEELNNIIHISSHDLRSPLVNIHGFSNELKLSIKYLDNLLNSIQLDDEIKKRITKILENDIPVSLTFISNGTLKLERLFNCLVELSNLVKMEIIVKDVNINMLVALIIDSYKKKINDENITIEINELPDCRGDEKQLSQLFINLIDNAVKFSSPARKSVIKIYGEKKKDKFIYCIEDNGIGIKNEQILRIFDLFYKYDYFEETNGDGLGLFIVKKIVENHNGSLKAESVFGNGTKIFIEIPVLE